MGHIKMDEWKAADVVAPIIGILSGFWSLISDMPMLSVGADIMGIMKACFTTACVTATGLAVKDAWPKIKVWCLSKIKRKRKL